jgi:hypothetical protein
VLAELFKVPDTVVGGVVRKICKRRAVAASTLVNKDDTIHRRIEKAGHRGDSATAGSAVNEENGFSVRISIAGVIDGVNVADLEVSSVVGLDRAIESSVCPLVYSGLFLLVYITIHGAESIRCHIT